MVGGWGLGNEKAKHTTGDVTMMYDAVISSTETTSGSQGHGLLNLDLLLYWWMGGEGS